MGNGIVSITAFGEGKGGHLELGPCWQNFHFTIPESLECGTLTRAIEGELEEGMRGNIGGRGMVAGNEGKPGKGDDLVPPH